MKKYIKSLSDFHIVESNDDNIISDNDLNSEVESKSIEDMENGIKEYTAKKTTLYNIYMQYKDKEDLKNRLVSASFAEKDGDTIKFNNPLLKSYSRISDLYRKIKDTEDYINNLKEEKTIKQKAASNNPNLAEGLGNQIKNIDLRIRDYEDKVKEYSKKINELDKKLEEKVRELKKDLIEAKKVS